MIRKLALVFSVFFSLAGGRLCADVVLLESNTFGEGLGQPARVTSTGSGWAATYPREDKVVIFSADGTVLREITGLSSPLGIAYAAPDKLYIGEQLPGIISVYNTSGVKLSSFGSGALTRPSEIQISNANPAKIYVLDPALARVRVFDMSGNYSSQIIDTGRLHKITGLSVDAANGTIMIGEMISGVCHIYNLSGVWQKDIAGFGKTPGKFMRVGGVTKSDLGMIAAVDPFLSRIQLLKLDGTYITDAGTFGSDSEQFQLPLDVAIGPSQQLVVTDFVNGRLVDYWICHTAVSDVMSLPVGLSVNLVGPIVTAGTGDFSNKIYVERDNRLGAIRVDNVIGSIDRGAIVQITGVISSDGNQKYINASNVTSITGWVIPTPLGFPGKGLGGVSPFANVPSVEGAVGPYNVGMLVKVWGKVASVEGNDFYLTNGLAKQIWAHAPDGIAMPAEDSWVSVTGICSVTVDRDGKRRAQILPRDAADIVVEGI